MRYVIGVNAEKKVACIHSNPPRIVPLAELVLKKRGYAITGDEVAMRAKTYP